MATHLTYKRFFAFSEREKKFFDAKFGDRVNIIYGPNTSGKSTVFLTLLYTFGVNDGNQYLKELLQESVLFRLDFTLTIDDEPQAITFIRDQDILYIRRTGHPIKRFNGISGDSSYEHIKLKEYLAELFQFSLNLESRGSVKPAPIETFFLPYYVSQSVGWVYLRKSFSSLEFYKNFKEDYLDYYLGVSSGIDRMKRHQLYVRQGELNEEIASLKRVEVDNEDLKITKLIDESFIDKSMGYVGEYSQRHAKLTGNENEYVLVCNELEFFEERRAVLRKISRNLKKQDPQNSSCPTCTQSLPFGISEFYSYRQEENDTAEQLTQVNAKIKETQAKVNSLSKEISEERDAMLKEYGTLKAYFESKVSYESWLNNKANVRLISNLNEKLGRLIKEADDVNAMLKALKSDEEIQILRMSLNREFKRIFVNYLEQFGVKKLDEDRFTLLYNISAFPSQGVELHKTVMAYHFAFNKLISSSPGIHRIPFMLDAVFKEDVDSQNKSTILTFISKNAPTDTQTIFSVAQRKDQVGNAEEYNKDFFEGNANLIMIGDGESERNFLMPYDAYDDEYLEETRRIMDGAAEGED